MNQTPLSIQFDPFQVFPLNFDVGVTSIQAFIYTGTDKLEYINMTCGCLNDTKNLDWISLNSTIITIQTSNKNYVGVHQIVLVQSFDVFEGVNPFAYFKLNIKSVPVFLE